MTVEPRVSWKPDPKYVTVQRNYIYRELDIWEMIEEKYFIHIYIPFFPILYP